MFDYRDGLVQFAFANEDVYVLDSLISLDLKGYLHYILKNRDYQHVCFLRGSRGHYTIQFPDRRSQEAYQRISWSMLDRLFKRDSGGYDPKPVLCSDDQVLRAMKKMDQTAFIFQIDSFDDCFREREEELAGLIRENDIKKNLILVLSGTTASESMPRFQDQEGIFMKKVQGTPLFPELSLAFGMTSGPEESCYTRLKTLLPDRCIFLNEMSGSPLVNLIWRVALNSPGLEDGLTEEDTCRIAAFIEAWYQSGKLQSRYRDCLSENELKKYSVLSGDLARSWSKIENAAREISPDMYMKNSRIILHVINDDTLNKQLGAVICPRETGVCKEDDEQMMARFIRLRQSYSIPGGFIPDPALEEILSGVIGQMNRMIMRGDSETFYRICTMLEYAVESGYAYDEMDYNIWEWYSKIIEISVSIFDLDHQIESN
ncbi:MAG: hypothetical protein IJ137_11595, partial [Eubacterium sp.]|nr:hypothetical protein [Eubacterium sp.]